MSSSLPDPGTRMIKGVLNSIFGDACRVRALVDKHEVHRQLIEALKASSGHSPSAECGRELLAVSIAVLATLYSGLQESVSEKELADIHTELCSLFSVTSKQYPCPALFPDFGDWDDVTGMLSWNDTDQILKKIRVYRLRIVGRSDRELEPPPGESDTSDEPHGGPLW